MRKTLAALFVALLISTQGANADLLCRIIGDATCYDLENDERIPIHGFHASLVEWSTGAATRAQVIEAWGILPGELADLDWLAARYAQAPTDKKLEFLRVMKNVFLLGELGKMNTTAISARIADAAAGNNLP